MIGSISVYEFLNKLGLYRSLITKMNNVSNMNNLITPEELASLLRMSKPSVYRLIEKRKIPFHKISGSLRFKLSDVEKYINDARIDSIV